jgi:AcrR family transcriptional regulator
VNKAALYRYFGNRAGLHRALIGRWVSRALADFRAVVFAGPPAPEMIERGFLAYLGVLERKRSTYLALTQLAHVAGPGGEEHLAAYIAAAGDVVTEVMYSRFPGVPAGGELGARGARPSLACPTTSRTAGREHPGRPRSTWRAPCRASCCPRSKTAFTADRLLSSSCTTAPD